MAAQEATISDLPESLGFFLSSPKNQALSVLTKSHNSNNAAGIQLRRTLQNK